MVIRVLKKNKMRQIRAPFALSVAHSPHCRHILIKNSQKNLQACIKPPTFVVQNKNINN